MRASTVQAVLVLLTLGAIVTAVDGNSGRAASATHTGQIVFSSNRQSRFDELYVINPNRTGLKKLTSGGPDALFPQWSPDGRRIAFERLPSCNGAGSCHPRIELMNADGSGLKPIRGAFFPLGLSWSPDGRRLAFTDFRNQGIYVVNTDGSGLRRVGVVRGVFPAWSPDGTRIAFLAKVAPGRQALSIAVIGLNGKGLRILTPSGAGPGDSFASWSPDGRRLTFSRFVAKVIQVFVMNADGSGVRRLTSLSHGASEPGWSPDSKRIVFAGGRSDGNSDIYVMNADGTQVARLTHAPPANDIGPAWGG